MERIRRIDGRSRAVVGGILALALAACAVEEPAESADAGSESEATQPAERTEPTRAAEPEARRTVPEGRTLVFRVEETVSTGSHDVGDEFTATLAEPVLAADGSEAIPVGTTSRWVVTESESESADSDRALLAVALRSVRLDGAPVPIEATVTGTEIQTEPGDSGTESVAKVAVGTAAGAIIGQILGRDTESTLKGAGVGAVVGTVVALTTDDGEARLTPGSTITVRLDESLQVG